MSNCNLTRSAIMLAVLCTMIILNPPAALAQCDPVEIAKLLASDGMGGERFGHAVAISGDTAIIGAHVDDDLGYQSGSAYIFRWDGNQWNEEAKLLAADGHGSDQFGYSVDIEGDLAVVGAVRGDGNEGSSGSAYIFRRNDTQWMQEAKVFATDGMIFDNFGCSVGLSGDAVVIGAEKDDVPGFDFGSAYVFRFNPDRLAWVEEAKLIASDGDAEDYFGGSVTISGSVIMIGAKAGDGNIPDSGSVYAFNWDDTRWIESAKLAAADGNMGDKFGYSVSISGDRVAIGAVIGDGNYSDTGAAYIFGSDGSRWLDEAKVVAADGMFLDYFGYSIRLSSDLAVIGAPWDDDGSSSKIGSVYVFKREGYTNWAEQAKLTASDAAAFDMLGYSVAVESDKALIGAPNGDGNAQDSGSTYVFDLNCGPMLSILGSCPGGMRFKVENATENERVAYIYARGTGSIRIPKGNPCAGTPLGLNQTAQLADVVRANANGTATLDVNVPAHACGGIHVQAIDLSNCATSNVLLVQ